MPEMTIEVAENIVNVEIADGEPGQITVTTESVGQVIEVGTVGPQGPRGTFERRHDVQTGTIYCGIALPGSEESDPVWKITRLITDFVGTITSSVVVENAIWADREILSYD